MSDYFSTRAQTLENLRNAIKGEEDQYDLFLLYSTSLATFNSIEAGLLDPNKLSPSPLSEIAYIENEKEIKWIPPYSHEDVEKKIEDTFHYLKWKDVYGLNLSDVFNLPYDVWKRLTKRLTDILKNKEHIVPTEHIVQLLTEVNQKLSVLIGQTVVPPDKKGPKNK